MPTFEEARAWLKAHQDVVMGGPTYVVFDIGEQRVRAVHRAALDEDWLIVASAICPSELMEPEWALQYNRYNEAIGALAVEQGSLQLRALVPLVRLAWATLERIIQYIAVESARLRACARPQRVFDPDMFESYVD